MSETDVEALGLTAQQIRAGRAYWTVHEIAQQPRIWPEILQLIASDTALSDFLAPLLEDPQLQVLLTGAGTSAFIGECLAPALVRTGRIRAEAISSTDIVASPASFLTPNAHTLIVHFSRSGNSPESVATVDLAEQRLGRCAHLIVTCNPEGKLYRRMGAMPRAHSLLLPQVFNDQSFAMTSSFTGMLTAAGMALRVLPIDPARLARLVQLAASVMSSQVPLLTSLIHAQFERIVYLGSAELKGLAREAALKMLELTDGRVVSLGETPLAFRHGPKTIVNGGTLVVAFLSNDSYARRYDLDLVAELRRDRVAARVITLANRVDVPADPDTLLLGAGMASGGGDRLTDLELCLPYIVFAQSLALLRSLSLGLSPDEPNAAGTVNRVVQGVSIHPYRAGR